MGWHGPFNAFNLGSCRQKAEGRKQKAESRRQKARFIWSRSYTVGPPHAFDWNSIAQPASTVLSQKSADKVFLVRAVFSQPRQGRKIVAQGASPGVESPHPVRRLTDTHLPPERERGRG
jgi:hypothetical protein